jgi:hypothetical protein
MIIKVREFDVLIDDEDYEMVSRYNWQVAMKRGTPYIQCSARDENGKKITKQLAREVTNAPKGVIVDHKSGNTLDNRKQNLRFSNNKTNAQNMRSNINSTSKYKGVSWNSERKKWRAVLKYNDKQVHIGRFNSEEEAARAYDKKALELFGEFARLNIKDSI